MQLVVLTTMTTLHRINDRLLVPFLLLTNINQPRLPQEKTARNDDDSDDSNGDVNNDEGTATQEDIDHVTDQTSHRPRPRPQQAAVTTKEKSKSRVQEALNSADAE